MVLCSYSRLTTPTSSVFVQRSFGHTPSAPVSERTLKRQIKTNLTQVGRIFCNEMKLNLFIKFLLNKLIIT